MTSRRFLRFYFFFFPVLFPAFHFSHFTSHSLYAAPSSAPKSKLKPKPKPPAVSQQPSEAALPGRSRVPQAASQKAKAVLPVPASASFLQAKKILFLSQDQWNLVGYFKLPQNGKPVFLCLHGVGSGKEEWAQFASSLSASGYGYLVYDGRGHGESQMGPRGKTGYRSFRSTGTDNEWNLMRYDLEAALGYLKSQGIEEGSVAMAGASIGANLMLNFAIQHPRISLTILLSPSMNYRDVPTVNAMRFYGGRPILLMAAASDRYSFEHTRILYAFARQSAGPENASLVQVLSGHGVNMLQPEVMSRLMGWISNPSQPLTVLFSTSPALSP